MKVKYSFKDERCEAEIFDDGNRLLFNGVADAILGKFKGKLVETVEGFDERYWDIKVGEKVVTLHLEHYLGIVLFSQDKEANDLVKEIGGYLEGIEPKQMFREWFYLKNIFRIRLRRRTSS